MAGGGGTGGDLAAGTARGTIILHGYESADRRQGSYLSSPPANPICRQDTDPHSHKEGIPSPSRESQVHQRRYTSKDSAE